MGQRIPTPFAASLNKQAGGYTDTYVQNGVYKFLGASVLSVNMSLGFNSTSSSTSITLVEDTVNGDLFLEPRIPSLWAFSLPRGGVGASIFLPDGSDLNQNGFQGPNVPFYFCGICTNWSVVAIESGGRTISVTLTDPKEILSGVQCLLGGFALSQNIGAGAPRYTGVDNVIDVFGYFNYGMESEKNEYGIPWYNVKEALESSRIQLYDMFFEFNFTGDTFTDTPDFYRLDDEIIDIVGLAQKVATDGGSDFITITRKHSSTAATIEFYGIRRTLSNPLTGTEILAFIATRQDIVESAKIGEEFRNEATSSIIIGGFQNANYLALPSTYVESMHGQTKVNDGYDDEDNSVKVSSFAEDYNAFPSDIKVRLFGGDATILVEGAEDEAPTEKTKTFDIKSGAILPFWGFTPDDHSYPLVEPYLPLDHLAFVYADKFYLELNKRLPYIKIGVKNFTVRVNPHTDMFFDQDGTQDDRPFAYVADIIRGTDGGKKPDASYVKGLPLNTEVLRAAGTSDSYQVFFDIYKLHFPDIADDLGFPGINGTNMESRAIHASLSGEKFDLRNEPIQNMLYDSSYLQAREQEIIASVNTDGKIPKASLVWNNVAKDIGTLSQGMLNFYILIYELVRQYALDHMGHKWIACLPRSIIMERIWANLPVPTRPEKPQIEYQVDQSGFWKEVPEELDGIAVDNAGSITPSSEEDQIRRKFMAEDGRFYPMVIMQNKPTGNINFNSNGFNAVMFQDLPVSDFRPNKIAADDFDRTKRVFISCNVNQLSRRPDLALVETSTPVCFDPCDSSDPSKFETQVAKHEFITSKKGFIKYFWYHIVRNAQVRHAVSICAANQSKSFYEYASLVVCQWADTLFKFYSDPHNRTHSTERVMDLEGISIPLTSTWLSYGPWFANYNNAKGMTHIEIDQSLVPWNFTDSMAVGNHQTNDGSNPFDRLEAAGQERLNRTIVPTEFLDSATITVAGFPEYGPAMTISEKSNLTSISVDFAIGGVRTTYNFATYFARPGTYRKSDYDNLSRARIDTRAELPQPLNENLIYNVNVDGTNRFRN